MSDNDSERSIVLGTIEIEVIATASGETTFDFAIAGLSDTEAVGLLEQVKFDILHGDTGAPGDESDDEF